MIFIPLRRKLGEHFLGKLSLLTDSRQELQLVTAVTKGSSEDFQQPGEEHVMPTQDGFPAFAVLRPRTSANQHKKPPQLQGLLCFLIGPFKAFFCGTKRQQLSALSAKRRSVEAQRTRMAAPGALGVLGFSGRIHKEAVKVLWGSGS